MAEAQAASARADVLTAEANARNAASDLERYSKLDPRAVSKQALDNATAAAATTKATLEAMAKKAEAADAQVKLAATQIRTAEADVRSADAALSNAKLQQSYTMIVARWPAGSRARAWRRACTCRWGRRCCRSCRRTCS